MDFVARDRPPATESCTETKAGEWQLLVRCFVCDCQTVSMRCRLWCSSSKWYMLSYLEWRSAKTKQRNQNKQGTQDPTSAIRESYQAFTAGCRQAAVDMAMIDAYEVQKCYYYDSDPSSDSESSSISGNGSCSDVDPYDDSSDMEGSPIDDCLGGVFSFLSLLLKKEDSANMSKGPLKFWKVKTKI